MSEESTLADASELPSVIDEELANEDSGSTSEQLSFSSDEDEAATYELILEDRENFKDDIVVVDMPKSVQTKLKCAFGVDLFYNQPWTTVPKSEIMKDLKRKNSVFMEYREQLQEYPFPEVLIGHEPCGPDREDLLVAITERGRNEVLKQLKLIQLDRRKRAVNMVVSRPRLSSSLGSEKEVVTDSPILKRPLYMFEWTGNIQSRPEKTKFQPLKPEDFSQEYEWMKKLSESKRHHQVPEIETYICHVDCQTDLKNAAVSSQTTFAVPVNASVQFTPEIEIPVNKGCEGKPLISLAAALKTFEDDLIDEVTYNNENLVYEDDYAELRRCGEPYNIVPTDSDDQYNCNIWLCYPDEMKGKVIRNISWHPTLSSVVALSYQKDDLHYTNFDGTSSTINPYDTVPERSTPKRELTKEERKNVFKKYLDPPAEPKKNNYGQINPGFFNEGISSEEIWANTISHLEKSMAMQEFEWESAMKFNSNLKPYFGLKKNRKVKYHCLIYRVKLPMTKKEITATRKPRDGTKKREVHVKSGKQLRKTKKSEKNKKNGSKTCTEEKDKLKRFKNKLWKYYRQFAYPDPVPDPFYLLPFGALGTNDTWREGLGTATMESLEADETFTEIWGSLENWNLGDDIRRSFYAIHREFQEKAFDNFGKCPTGPRITKEQQVSQPPLCKAAGSSKHQIRSVRPDSLLVKRKLGQEEDHVVLIWFLDNICCPNLKLFCPYELTELQFCPHNGNYIVGGTVGGQILFWDITGKLDFEHPMLRMGPRNKQKSIPTIDVTVESAISQSHTDKIVNLHWVHPCYEVTDNGHLKLLEEQIFSHQFITVARDGFIKVWELNNRLEEPMSDEENIESETDIESTDNEEDDKEMMEIKEKLRESISGFHLFDAKCIPIATFCIRGEHDEKEIRVFSFALKSMPLKYEREDNLEIDERSKECVTDIIKCKVALEGLQKNMGGDLMFNGAFIQTAKGNVEHIFWKEFTTSSLKGLQRDEYKQFHDGFIKYFASNHFLPHLFLSIGGKVFVLWHFEERAHPIKWVPYDIFLTGGCWSPFRPSMFYICRSDGAIEIWDFLLKCHEPEKIMHLTTLPVIGLSMQDLPLRNRLLGIADTRGVLHVYTIPKVHQEWTKEELVQLDKLCSEEITHNKETKKLITLYQERDSKTKDKETDKAVSDNEDSVKDAIEDENKSEPILEKVTCKKRYLQEVYKWYLRRRGQRSLWLDKADREWYIKEEHYMIKQILLNKKWDPKEMDTKMKALIERDDQEAKRFIKMDEMISCADSTFQEASSLLYRPAPKRDTCKEIKILPWEDDEKLTAQFRSILECTRRNMGEGIDLVKTYMKHMKLRDTLNDSRHFLNPKFRWLRKKIKEAVQKEGYSYGPPLTRLDIYKIEFKKEHDENLDNKFIDSQRYNFIWAEIPTLKPEFVDSKEEKNFDEFIENCKFQRYPEFRPHKGAAELSSSDVGKRLGEDRSERILKLEEKEETEETFETQSSSSSMDEFDLVKKVLDKEVEKTDESEGSVYYQPKKAETPAEARERLAKLNPKLMDIFEERLIPERYKYRPTVFPFEDEFDEPEEDDDDEEENPEKEGEPDEKKE